MSESPSPTADNGRGPGGRFAVGNKLALGNPFAKRVADLRAALFNAVSPDELQAVVAKLLEQAKAGDVASIKELLQRVLGPPEALDLIDRMDALEQQLAQLTADAKCRV